MPNPLLFSKTLCLQHSTASRQNAPTDATLERQRVSPAASPNVKFRKKNQLTKKMHVRKRSQNASTTGTKYLDVTWRYLKKISRNAPIPRAETRASMKAHRKVKVNCGLDPAVLQAQILCRTLWICHFEAQSNVNTIRVLVAACLQNCSVIC